VGFTKNYLHGRTQLHSLVLLHYVLGIWVRKYT